jgi:hypothetical protein
MEPSNMFSGLTGIVYNYYSDELYDYAQNQYLNVVAENSDDSYEIQKALISDVENHLRELVLDSIPIRNETSGAWSYLLREVIDQIKFNEIAEDIVDRISIV